jgi:hypothetical protein
MTKGTDHMLFIAGSTCEMLSETPEDLVFVDEFEVRGRNAKMRIFSIPDPLGSPGPEPAPAAPAPADPAPAEAAPAEPEPEPAAAAAAPQDAELNPSAPPDDKELKTAP